MWFTFSGRMLCEITKQHVARAKHKQKNTHSCKYNTSGNKTTSAHTLRTRSILCGCLCRCGSGRFRVPINKKQQDIILSFARVSKKIGNHQTMLPHQTQPTPLTPNHPQHVKIKIKSCPIIRHANGTSATRSKCWRKSPCTIPVALHNTSQCRKKFK